MKEDISTIDYSTVTELCGAEISHEQLDRLCHRYYWASSYCQGKEVIECACGTGPGLGFLAGHSKRLSAGDYTKTILTRAREHYGSRVELLQFDAQHLPYEDGSTDVIILFEAIYYLADARKFVAECRRVLRPNGYVLIATANKDLYDFNPSPHSHVYYGVVELHRLFSEQGFETECFGYLSTTNVSSRQRLVRPIKRAAVMMHVMPKTAHGKKWLKRLVFGSLTRMPAEIGADMIPYTVPEPVLLSEPDRRHKVIYCAARVAGD